MRGDAATSRRKEESRGRRGAQREDEERRCNNKLAQRVDERGNSASVGCYEFTTDFGSRFGIHSPNAINVSIVGMLDVDVNAN